MEWKAWHSAARTAYLQRWILDFTRYHGQPGSEYYSCAPWKQRRAVFLESRGVVDGRGLCDGCGEVADHLHVHHVTYERLFGEADADLRLLCKTCHAQVHRHGGRRQSRQVGVVWLDLAPMPDHPQLTTAQNAALRERFEEWAALIRERAAALPAVPEVADV